MIECIRFRCILYSRRRRAAVVVGVTDIIFYDNCSTFAFILILYQTYLVVQVLCVYDLIAETVFPAQVQRCRYALLLVLK